MSCRFAPTLAALVLSCSGAAPCPDTPVLPPFELVVADNCPETAATAAAAAAAQWNDALGSDVWSVGDYTGQEGPHVRVLRCRRAHAYCAPGFWNGWHSQGLREISLCVGKQTPAEWQWTLAHEMGHAMGLGHTSCGVMSSPATPCDDTGGAVRCENLLELIAVWHAGCVLEPEIAPEYSPAEAE